MNATVEHINKEVDYKERLNRGGPIAELLHREHLDNCSLIAAALKVVDYDNYPEGTILLEVINKRMLGQIESFDKLMNCFPGPLK